MPRIPLPSGRAAAGGLLLLLCAVVPLGRGGLTPPVQIGALLAGCLALALSPRRSDASVSLAGIALLVLASVVGLQLLPLPAGVLKHLAPATAAHFRAILEPVGLYPFPRPLSLDPGATAAELSRATALAAIALATGVLARDVRLRLRLLAGVAVTGVVVALVTLSASAGGVASYLEPRVVFVNKNHFASLMNLAAFTALGLSMRARGPTRFFWLSAVLLCGVETALSLSRGGISAFVAGCVIFWWAQTRAIAREGRQVGQRALVLGAVASIVVVAGTLAAGPLLERLQTARSVSQETRLALWPTSLGLLREHAWLGIGRGAFPTTFAGYKNEPDPYTFTHVENELLQLPIDVGLPAGLTVLFLLAWSYVRAALRRDLSRVEVGAIAGLGAVALQNLVDFSLEIPGVSIPATVSLCLVVPSLRWRTPSWLLRLVAAVAVTIGAAGFVLGHRLPADDVVRRVELAGVGGAAKAALPYLDWHPADYLPHAAVGAVLVRADRCSDASPWLSRAMVLNPTAPEPHHYAARCLAAAGQAPSAQQEFRLAIMLGDLGAIREASYWFPTLDELLKATPDTPDARRKLAETIAVARPADAARILQTLIDEFPDPVLLPLLARARLDAGEADAALVVARSILRAQPFDTQATMVAFLAALQLGREDEAWALIEAANRMSPGQPEIVQQLVKRLLDRRRFSEARRLIETIMPSNTREMAVRETLVAQVLMAQGRDEEAAGHLELAAAAPGSRTALELLATVLEKLGRFDEAIAKLERASAIPDTPPGAYESRISQIRSRSARGGKDPQLPVEP